MTPLLNIHGDRYEISEPCYYATPQGLIYNRITRSWVSFASLDAKATAESYTWNSREIGIPSLKWQLVNNVGPGVLWAPWENSSAFVSNTVANGEDFTGAAGATPPTSWIGLGTASYSLDAGPPTTMTMTNPAAGDDSISQTQTTVAGEAYVFEVMFEAGTTDNIFVAIDGVELPYGGSKGHAAFSLIADDTDVDISFIIRGPGTLVLDWVRFYNENELTGGGSGAAGVPNMPAVIQGPFMADGVEFWINTNNCLVGFDVDSDPLVDVWLNGAQVCAGDLTDQVKMAISAQLVALGCPKLPCVTMAGKMTAAYVKAQSEDDEE